MCAHPTQFLTVMLGAAIAVWGADPIIGTWNLNLAKSKFNPGPPPKSETRIYQELVPKGIKVTFTTIDADGKSTSIELPTNEDGKDYHIIGPGPADTIVMTKIDSVTAEAVLKHGDTVIGVARRVISSDGKTMTITYKGTDMDSRQVNNIEVYEKK